jgi:hypothetical protein
MNIQLPDLIVDPADGLTHERTAHALEGSALPAESHSAPRKRF